MPKLLEHGAGDGVFRCSQQGGLCDEPHRFLLVGGAGCEILGTQARRGARMTVNIHVTKRGWLLVNRDVNDHDNAPTWGINGLQYGKY